MRACVASWQVAVVGWWLPALCTQAELAGWLGDCTEGVGSWKENFDIPVCRAFKQLPGHAECIGFDPIWLSGMHN